MRYQRMAVPVALLLLLAACGGERVNIDPIVNAEREFAADVAATSIKEGFLKHLDPDAVIFTPAPMNAHKAYGGIEATSARLVWVPDIVDIDSEGRFGWASGPWLYYPDEQTTASVEAGSYATVWQRGREGWRVLLDIGVDHDPLPYEGVEPGLWKGNRGAIQGEVDPGQLTELIGRAEHQLASRSMELGFRTALLEVTDPEVLVLRDGKLPAKGATASTALLQGETGVANWAPAGIVVSSSGEIAFAFGTGNAELEEEDMEFAYARIWRWSGEGWHVAADIRELIPVRPEAQEDAQP